MNLRLCLLSLALLVSSCSSARLASNAVAKAQAQAQGESNPQASGDSNPPPESYNSAEPETKAPPLDPVASDPAIVGGAYLTCALVDGSSIDVSCVATNDEGKPFAFAAKNAYLISGNPSRWQLHSFEAVPNEVGQWRIKLAEALPTSFGIGFVNADNEAIMDFVDTRAPGFNLVLNGSFEDRKSQNDFGYDYAFNDPTGAWTIATQALSSCQTPVFEIQFVPSEGIAPDGKQWTEIDSACTVSLPDETALDSGNIVLSQDVPVLAGHYYQVVFSYNAGSHPDLPDLKTAKFRSTFGETLLIEREARAGNWIQLKSVVRAKDSKKARLAFEELGIPDHFGTLIDDVKVFDLGVGP